MLLETGRATIKKQEVGRGTAGSSLVAHRSFLKTDKLIKGLAEKDKAKGKAMPSLLSPTQHFPAAREITETLPK